jgi:hypothetical protein
MRKLALLLLLASGAAAAGWTQVSADTATTTYADPATMQKSGNTAKMWSLVDFKEFQRMVEVGYFSQKFQVEYDCTEKRLRRLVQSYHAANMGEGKVVYSDDTAQEWETVQPASMNETLLKAACK